MYPCGHDSFLATLISVVHVSSAVHPPLQSSPSWHCSPSPTEHTHRVALSRKDRVAQSDTCVR